MGNLCIIKMDQTHIESIVKIEKQCFVDPWSRAGFEEELENENAYFIVALLDKKVCGYAGMYHICGEAYIANIAVLPEFRGQNIGKSLLENLILNAQLNNCEFISLEVRKTNFVAICLYKRLGFKEVGVRKEFYQNPKEDAFIMTKYFKTKEK